MKKALTILLALAMVFAFVACEDTPELKSIATEADLEAFAGQTGDFKGVTEAAITAEIKLTKQISFATEGLTLVGNGGKLVVDTITVTDGQSFSQLAINAADITFDGVVIDVTATTEQKNFYAINVMPSIRNFTFENGMIQGKYSGELIGNIPDQNPSNYNVIMGINFSVGTSGKVLESKILGCVAPVNASTNDLEIKNVEIEGHIYLDVPSTNTLQISGVKTPADSSWKGHVDFTKDTDQTNAKALLASNSVDFYCGSTKITVDAAE